MHLLTIVSRFPNDDEVSQISYGFETIAEAEQARDAVSSSSGKVDHFI